MTQRREADESGDLPLSGVRVVEFTHMVMGPTCGMILADLGAEVIKVEPPGGEKTRRLPGLGVGFFHAFNRNKKSVTIDIKTAAGQQTARELVGTADVVLENFRPGLMQDIGLDYETLSNLYPALIYVSHKGFLSGPYENRVALDEVVQNMAGLTYMTGPKGMPLRAGTSVNDIMGGMFGAIGVLAALRERERTGKGQEIQSALFENCCLLASQHMHQYQLTGEVPPPFPSRVSAWSVYDTFEVANGEQLFIGAVSDRQFQVLCDVLNRPDLANTPHYQTNTQRVEHRPALIADLAGTIQQYDRELLCAKLESAGLPFAKVVRPDELVQDPHLLGSGGLVPMQTPQGTVKSVLLPLTMNGRRLGVRHPLPQPGEHNEECLVAQPSRASH